MQTFYSSCYQRKEMRQSKSNIQENMFQTSPPSQIIFPSRDNFSHMHELVKLMVYLPKISLLRSPDELASFISAIYFVSIITYLNGVKKATGSIRI